MSNYSNNLIQRGAAVFSESRASSKVSAKADLRLVSKMRTLEIASGLNELES